MEEEDAVMLSLSLDRIANSLGHDGFISGERYSVSKGLYAIAEAITELSNTLKDKL